MFAILGSIPIMAQAVQEHNVWMEMFRSLAFAALFGILGIVLAIFAYRLFDWVSPIDVEKELGENRNIAVAILMAAFLLGICIIISRAIGS